MKLSRISIIALFFTLLVVSSCRTDSKPEETKADITTVNTHIRANPDRLNAILTLKAHSSRVNTFLFPTLIEFDPVTLKLSPMLVKSLPEVKDVTEGEYAGYTSFTYEFLEEAKWDNGQPVLGHDYAFTVKMIKNPYVAAPAFRGLIQFIKAVEVDSDNPRKFTIYSDESYIRSVYSTGGFYLYPEYFYDPSGLLKDFTIAELNDTKAERSEDKDAKLKAFADRFNSDALSRDSIVNCHAYQLHEWIPNERVVLRKKENWWGDALADKNNLLKAGPKELVFNIVPKGPPAVNLMKNEEIDCVTYLEDDVFAELENNELVNKNYNLLKVPTADIQYMAINMRNPKLQDKRVRQAIAHLVDIDEIIKTLKLGNAQPIIGPIPPMDPMSAYYHKGLTPRKYDLEKAKTLLDEAGWKDSDGNGIRDKEINGAVVELSLDFIALTINKVSENIPLMIKESAKAAGIEINVEPVDVRTFIDRRRKREFDFFTASMRPDLDYYDPYQLWHTSQDVPAAGNYFGFGNADSDKLIEELRVTNDTEKLFDSYRKFQETIYDEQPAVFLYNSFRCMAIHKRLGDPMISSKKPHIHEGLY